MLLVSKAALSGIVFLLLATGISGPRPTVVPSANLGKGVLAVEDRNDVKKLQETLRDNGHYRGGVDGVLGLRTRASIRAYQRAENLPVTGALDVETAGKLGVRPQGQEKTGYEAIQGKPSAGIKDRGSRRTSKTLPKAAKGSNHTVPPA
jgi:peptidoglycan hydrolase-like protein with peptidoglycan-binding domain